MSLITIAIPTYNRENQLRKCLSSICNQLDPLSDKVDILVSDNSSDYDVSNIIMEFKKLGYPINLNINEENMGMTNNFKFCLSSAIGEYVWLFSDDEYLSDNKLCEIVDIINENKPNLIFINNSRVKKNANDISINYKELGKDKFIIEVGMYPTLISKNIFKKSVIEEFLNDEYKTLFLHVSLFYKVIRKYDNLAIIDGDIFTITPGNSSGYKWFETFIIDLTEILDMNDDIINKNSRKYLDNQLLKYYYFKQFLSAGMGKIKKKRDILENFNDEDFKSVYKMIKSKFLQRRNFWIYIFSVYIMPKKVRILLYSFLMEYVLPVYRKKD